jgi:transposase
MPRRPPQDPKLDALREQGALNSQAQAVSDPLFLKSDFFDARDLLQVKYEMVRCVEVEGRSIIAATQAFGFSRPSFYQIQATLRKEGLQGLLPRKRGPKGAHKLTPEIMAFITDAVGTRGKLGARALVEKIKERFGLKLHPRSVERAFSGHEKKRP